ncbi:MAG: type II toxin-antitoxin system Phd/YefM family antitoxin [Blastocatellia bacterium]
MELALPLGTEEAQAHLTELIRKLEPGEELVIVEGGNPVATLSRSERTRWPSQPGTAQQIGH